nr:Rrf2 family transcriptional regulator [Synechococcus sp. HK05]
MIQHRTAIRSDFCLNPEINCSTTGSAEQKRKKTGSQPQKTTHSPWFQCQTAQRRIHPAVGFCAKTTYGLLALLELAGVQGREERLQVAEIAARQAIPERYLEQMMAMLRRGGLLRSIRGARGGFQLARPAAEITLLEVILCLEGESKSISPGASSAERRVIEQLGSALLQQRLARLEAISLADLLHERDAMLQAQTMYFI